LGGYNLWVKENVFTGEDLKRFHDQGIEGESLIKLDKNFLEE